MRSHGLFRSLFVLAVAGIGVPNVIACHVDAHTQVGESPPPTPPSPPAPPPPATTVAQPSPPPPPAPPKRVIALKGVQMKSATQIDMPGDIEFQKASSAIVMNDKTKRVLTQLAAILKDNPEITKLSIEGNTDNEGESKGFDNRKLSEQRAQAVIEWLSKQGVDSKRLTAVGKGSKNPLEPNDTPEHMAQNRRVEFHVREFNGQVTATETKATAAATNAPLANPPPPGTPPPTTTSPGSPAAAAPAPAPAAAAAKKSAK